MVRTSDNNQYITRAEFKAFEERIDRRFLEVLAQLKAQGEELKAQRHWTEIVVGGFQRRAGRNLEEMVAGCLRVALDMRDIHKENLKLRRKFVDEQGEIGPAGRKYEIDLHVSDTKSFFFEIKSVAEPEDVERFVDKAGLAAKKWGLAAPERVLVTLEKGSQMQGICRRLGVTLV